MDKIAIKKIMSYLCAAYPANDFGDKKKTDAVISVWEDILKVFPYEIGQQAAKEYVFSGNKYFPTIAELVVLCDTAWEREIERRKREEKENDIVAYRKLFRDPVEYAEDYKKMSVQLIRDAWEGKVKYGSTEWKSRFAAIYGPDINPMTGV